jgi:bifunctional UDP-N-acetylglucosamine pyrophosphorylase/glucosamine-1-phosphate N-acetyltransferase
LGAIVLAAGRGTRMRSPRSKLLHTLLGEPLVFFPLHALYKAGVRHFVIVVGHAAEDVEKAITTLPFLTDCKLQFVVQSPQRGTGHAVQVALEAVKKAPAEWVIAYGDSPHLDADTLTRLVEKRRSSGCVLTLLAAELEQPQGYGRLIVDNGKLSRIVEDKDADESERRVGLVNAGAYAVSHKFLREAIAELEPKNAQKELYLTDIVAMAKGDARVHTTQNGDVVLGVNSQGELMRSQRLLQERLIAEWHDKGVSIEAADVLIGPRVELEAGAIIERGATLLGTTRVNADALIEHHAHLRDVVVEEGARVRAFTYAEEAEIGPKAQVGPVSRLRSGAVLEEGAEIGNFCEVKKTRIKARAKSHHVSYLGDAEIGAGTNVGAGTIICNYDGFSKPFSRIGAEVFIGSNSTLIAPVQIGDKAYIAAGSAITDPVPSEAVAFGRARQVTKEGYARALRDKLGGKKKKT